MLLHLTAKHDINCPHKTDLKSKQYGNYLNNLKRVTSADALLLSPCPLRSYHMARVSPMWNRPRLLGVTRLLPELLNTRSDLLISRLELPRHDCLYLLRSLDGCGPDPMEAHSAAIDLGCRCPCRDLVVDGPARSVEGECCNVGLAIIVILWNASILAWSLERGFFLLWLRPFR